MTWTSHPHRIDHPTAIAWRGDAAVAVADDEERVEAIELAVPGSRRIDESFDEITGGGEPERVPGFDPDDVTAVARSAGGSTLVSTTDAVFLVRGDRSPRWIAGSGAIGFAGERPIVDACVFSESGDPRRVLSVAGSQMSVGAIAAGPGGRVAIACPRVVHVISASDVCGADPLPGPVGQVTDLALAGGYLAAVSERDELVVFDRASGSIAARWHHDRRYHALVGFIDPETLVLSASYGLEVWRWRERRRIDRWELGELSAAEALVCGRGKVLAANGDSVTLLSTGGDVLAEIDLGEDAWLRDVDLHPIEPRFAVAVADRPVLVIGDDGAELARLPEAEHLAFSAARIWLSDHDASRSIAWPPDDAPPGASLDPFERAARVDGGLLVAGDAQVTRLGDDGAVRWEAVYRDGVEALAGDYDEPVFYTAGRSPWIAERRIADGSLARVLPAGAGAAISALAIADDGHHLVAGDESGRIAVWELGERCKRIGLADSSDLAVSERFEPGELGEITAVSFGPELVALGDRVLRWKGPLIGDIGRRDPDRVDIEADCLSPDGERVALTRWDAPIEIWSLRSGQLISRVPEPDDVYGLRLMFSPSGDRLVVADAHTVAVWAVDGGELIGRLDVDKEISGVAFAGDRHVVAWVERHFTAAGSPGVVVRWNPETTALERWIAADVELAGASGLCVAGDRALMWSPELSYLIEGGAVTRVLPPHRAMVRAAALSPAGIVATGDGDGVIRIRDAGGELACELCSTADGSWWRSAPEFFWEPSPNLAEGRW